MYSQKVRAICFVSVATLATFNWASTQSMYIFNTGESSDGDVEISNYNMDIHTYKVVGK
jgi:hypothetical protein